MKQKIRKNGWVLILLPFILLTNVGFFSPPGDNYFEISKNLDIFGKAYREINANYVDDIAPEKIMRIGIDAMLGSLDPYTNYISAGEIEDYTFMSTGQYGGIGAQVGRIDGKVTITEPYEGEPAAVAGLRAGDVIIKIDDEDVSDANSNSIDVRELLRGQPNTTVVLTIRREGSPEPLKFDVVRGDIKILNVPYSGMINDKIGYISLSGFTQGAADEVKQALEKLKRENAGINGVVLDLRGNPGGLLREAVAISNIFVPQGEKIVETRGRIEGSENMYHAQRPPVDTEIPLAVLVNRRSASASEIVSGVMQDLDRGVVVGQRSFGKGLVQTTRPLSFNSSIKITTAKYYTPSGRCIQAIDYSNRNEDGSVGKVPDSLQKEFKTQGGRSVFDGGGVLPDVEVKLPDYHTVTRELIQQNIIFDFATKFQAENEKIAPAREFEISDAVYADLEAYAKSRGFAYETKTEKEFVRLEELMREEAYFDDLESELKNIQSRIDEEKKEDMKTFRGEIADFLKSEIIRRYYFRKGELEASFDMDPDILAAIEVLNNPAQYNKILAGK